MQKDANFKHTNINTHKTKGWKKSPLLQLYFSGSRFQLHPRICLISQSDGARVRQ